MSRERKNWDPIRAVLQDTPLSEMALVEQCFLPDAIQDVSEELDEQFARIRLSQHIRSGMRVALTGSSRQIDRMQEVLSKTVSALKRCGADPFLVPAMGSHGGGTAQGQSEILSALGITERTIGCPVRSSMETVEIGKLSDGSPVHMDRLAHEADGIVVIGRIKPHTAFRGNYESGLVKMLAIGLGKQAGAESLHSAGYGEMAERLPAYAKVVCEQSHVLLGIGLIENEEERLCRIEVLPGDMIFEREGALLSYARTRMPRILLPQTDVLVVEEIGKNFSGAGMDPNVTGTFSTPYAVGGIEKQRTVVLGISRESKGNFLGLGMADITTERAVSQLDRTSAYLNAITDKGLEPVKIPLTLPNDKLALQAAVRTLVNVDRRNIRMVFVKNTRYLRTILLSRASLRQAASSGLLTRERQVGKLCVIHEAAPLMFDENDNLSLSYTPQQ